MQHSSGVAQDVASHLQGAEEMFSVAGHHVDVVQDFGGEGGIT